MTAVFYKLVLFVLVIILFVFNSVRMRKEFYNQAKLQNFKQGSESYERFKDVFAAAGHPNSIFKISYNQLIKITNGLEKEIYSNNWWTGILLLK